MIRNPEGLIPEVRTKILRWYANCLNRGVEVLVYCTRRTAEEQAELYAQGRTAPGSIVTNAKPWQSAHQYGRAVDAVPIVNGKLDWNYLDVNHDSVPDKTEWRIMVEEADKLGLEWAGRWKTFKEFVHFQDLGGKTITELYETEGPGHGGA